MPFVGVAASEVEQTADPQRSFLYLRWEHTCKRHPKQGRLFLKNVFRNSARESGGKTEVVALNFKLVFVMVNFRYRIATMITKCQLFDFIHSARNEPIIKENLLANPNIAASSVNVNLFFTNANNVSFCVNRHH